MLLLLFVVLSLKSFLTPCDPMDCSMPGSSVFHYLLEFAQTHVHWVSDAIQPSHLLLPPSPSSQSLPASGSFPMSRLFASGGQSTGASASATVLPMTIQGWFPLGLTGLISLQSKGLSRIFSNTMFQSTIKGLSDQGLWTAESRRTGWLEDSREDKWVWAKSHFMFTLLNFLWINYTSSENKSHLDRERKVGSVSEGKTESMQSSLPATKVRFALFP